MAIDKSRLSIPHILKTLWLNWMISYGAITLPLLLGIFTPKLWLPFICLAEVYLLSAYSHNREHGRLGADSLPIEMTIKALTLAAAAMFVVVILCTDWLVPTVIHLKLYNSEIPFVTCLVMFPIVAGLCAATVYMGLGAHRTRESQRRTGFYAGDSVMATLYYNESKYQVKLLMMLALLLGGVEYWYYFARYINSDMNAPDRFFFNYMPIVMFLLSAAVMWGRYENLSNLLNTMHSKHLGDKDLTLVRYLILCGNNLLLKADDDMSWDTPAQIQISRTNSLGDRQARTLFAEKTGISDFDLRYCYANEGYASAANVLHYAVFVPSQEQAPEAPAAQWFNAYMIDTALAANALAPLLANELYRIHTITMAWKTYDREGKRLYPIKHYRPTFHIGDLREWNVDYDDASWFDIAHNNEDRPFFRLRKLWRRMTGVFHRKSTVA